MGSMEIKAPGKLPKKVFLAGSIEMGKAVNWQTELVEAFKDREDVIFYNPRRDDWDSSWVQSEDNLQFNEQVNWELNALEDADIVVFYFDPATKSPITLMELGLMAGNPENARKCIVCCPEGFWRKGNVDVLCSKFFINKHPHNLEMLKKLLAIWLR